MNTKEITNLLIKFGFSLMLLNSNLYAMQENPEQETKKMIICPICREKLEEENLIRTPCNHLFHNRCFEQLTIKHKINSCPVCRETLDPSKPETCPQYEDEIDYLIQRIQVIVIEIYPEDPAYDNIDLDELSPYNIKLRDLFLRQKRCSQKCLDKTKKRRKQVRRNNKVTPKTHSLSNN